MTPRTERLMCDGRIVVADVLDAIAKGIDRALHMHGSASTKSLRRLEARVARLAKALEVRP